MAQKPESNRPEHGISYITIPRGHGHLDPKFEKMGRSPLVGQLPMENGLGSASNDDGLNRDDGSLAGTDTGGKS